VSGLLEREFDLTSDHQRYHDVAANAFMRKFEKGRGAENNIVLRVAWSACLWDSRHMAIAKTMADSLNNYFENDIVKEYAPDLKIVKCGY
jgi:voltage-gated potassium channel